MLVPSFLLDFKRPPAYLVFLNQNDSKELCNRLPTDKRSYTGENSHEISIDNGRKKQVIQMTEKQTQIKEPQLAVYAEQLTQWVQEYRTLGTKGKCASYIPALKSANPTDLGITIISNDGNVLSAGESEKLFTIQSICKIITFILVCMNKGIRTVLQSVDVEPTGDPFNSMIRLEAHEQGKPFNPLINAGAITVCSLLPGSNVSEKLNTLLQFFEQLIRRRPQVNETVFQSEWETGHRNRALAYFLKDSGYLEGDVNTVLEVYFRECAIELNTKELALIGSILSQDGYHPLTHQQVFPPQIAKVAKALMLTCGMYNSSGKLAAFIGIPAKSGVSGGIMATLPPRTQKKDVPFAMGCGIGIYGPSIDKIGNSYAGTRLLEQLSRSWSMNIF